MGCYPSIENPVIIKKLIVTLFCLYLNRHGAWVSAGGYSCLLESLEFQQVEAPVVTSEFEDYLQVFELPKVADLVAWV